MLSRFGFDLTRRGDVRHQREVDEHRPVSAEVETNLANGLEERLAFDIAHRAANLYNHDIPVFTHQQDAPLDFIGDVGDHLHRAAQIVAAALLSQNLGVHRAGGEVVRPGHGVAGETLIVTEIKIGFGTIHGHEHLAVLKRAHRPRIHVEIGVHLQDVHFEISGVQKCGKRRRENALAQRGNNTASYKNIARHGTEKGHLGSRETASLRGTDGESDEQHRTQFEQDGRAR